MVASNGSITHTDIAYTLPYAQGLQLIWDHKMGQGEQLVALWPDSNSGSAIAKETFHSLLG